VGLDVLFELIRPKGRPIRVVQARRIACESCGGRFTYLAETTETFVGEVRRPPDRRSGQATAGSPLSDGLLAFLDELDADSCWGDGPCPHCGRYHRWMVWRSRKRRLPLIWARGKLPAAVAFLLVLYLAGWNDVSVLGALLSAGAYISVMGFMAAVEWRHTLPWRAPVDGGHPRSAADGPMRGRLGRASMAGADPAVDWYGELRGESSDDAYAVAIGCRDLTGEGFFPERFTGEGSFGIPLVRGRASRPRRGRGG
jgi:hypothetical protein